MTRFRSLVITGAVIALAASLQLVGASTAAAAATCKSYDAYVRDGNTTANVRVCAAPSTDYPSYSGWGRIKVGSSSVLPNPCGPGGSLLPMDRDDPMPPCYNDAFYSPPAPEYGWHWTSYGWVQGAQLATGMRAYFAPYTGGWRWGWTADRGWFALPASDAYFLWYA
jgi:hypothetical protein